jgi:hypothetical protein
MVEILNLRLNHDADSEAFQTADADVQQTFFYGQPGIRRRTTAHATDGQWAVLTFWDSDEVADAAAAKARFPEDFEQVAKHVDPASITRTRFHES